MEASERIEEGRQVSVKVLKVHSEDSRVTPVLTRSCQNNIYYACRLRPNTGPLMLSSRVLNLRGGTQAWTQRCFLQFGWRLFLISATKRPTQGWVGGVRPSVAR